MRDYRTDTERIAHAVIDLCLYRFTAGKLYKFEFTELLGTLRNVKKLLDNKEHGCSTGRHSVSPRCNCEK